MEPNLESVTALATLRHKRGHRKTCIVKGEKFLYNINTLPLSDGEALNLERHLSTTTAQRAGYVQIQSYLIDLMEDCSDTEESDLQKELDELSEHEPRFDHLVDQLETVKYANDHSRTFHMMVRTAEDLAELMEEETDLSRADAKRNLTILDDKVSALREQKANIPRQFCDGPTTILKGLTKRLRDIHSKDPAILPAPVRDPIPATVISAPHQSRLPRIEMPSFTGDYMDWVPFWDRFSQCLADEPRLTNADKVSYLRSAIKCERGIDVLKAAPGMGNDFNALAGLLHSTFNLKRLAFRTHLRRLAQYRMRGGTKTDVSQLNIHIQQGLFALRESGQYEADYLITAMTEMMMDETTLAAWTLYSKEHDKVPPVSLLVEFLTERITVLPDTEAGHSKRPQQSQHSSDNRSSANVKRPLPPQTNVFSTQRDKDCSLCHDGPHSLASCQKFRSLSQAERFTVARNNKVCTNCLSSFHSHADCQSRRDCRVCGKRHHSLLHRPEGSAAPVVKTEPGTATSTTPVLGFTQNEDGETHFMTGRGVVHTQARSAAARIFFDTGAGITLITSKLAQTLRAKSLPGTATLSGIAGLQTKPCKQVQIELSIGNNEPNLHLKAAVVDRIATDLPENPVSINRKDPVFKDITLSDPHFDRPGPVDLLVGLKVFNRVFMPEAKRQSLDGSITAYCTTLGWIVSCETNQPSRNSQVHITTSSVLDDETHNMISSFWKMEQGPFEQSILCKDEQRAVEHFNSTHSRQADGRYEVCLPRKSEPPILGRSREQATCRYLQNEKSLKKKNQWTAFSDVVAEYSALNHAEQVPSQDLNKSPQQSYYLPMHGVVKDTSTTTKLRVVFDASARTSSGASFNDTLLAGPNLYPMLDEILLLFRSHSIGMTADISKMFREIVLHPSERDWHRFLWRGQDGILIDWRMKRLTFGITSSPFVATQVVRQLAKDYQQQFSRASEIIRRQFYVDDCLTGAATVSDAITIRQELNQLLEKGCMTLRKWRSSSTEVCKSITPELQEEQQPLSIASPSHCHKALGVHWDTHSDTLHVATPTLVKSPTTTKRQITSDLAKTFDVMGWFTPAILIPKILIQTLWKLGTDWDATVPGEVASSWEKWKEQLPSLTLHSIPRFFHNKDKKIQSAQLHGFCDASLSAYACVLYLRTFYADTTVSISLVTAKSRLAPLKAVTIPRLELCGAQLLSHVMKNVQTILQIQTSLCFCWCDSTITLAWLHHDTGRLQTFVANRVSDIIAHFPAVHWRHVPTLDNPADVASRGLQPLELLAHQQWWNGPPWLIQIPSTWPARSDYLKKKDLPETKTSVLSIVQPFTKDPPSITIRLVARISSWIKMRRVMAWVLRMADHFKHKRRLSFLPTHPLCVTELEMAGRTLHKLDQQLFYSNEISALRRGDSVSVRSPLASRAPFLDAEGLLHVGGRLQRSDLNFGIQHPIICHKDAATIKPLIRWMHVSSNHLGSSGLIGLMSTTLHILGVRRTVREVTSTCVPCRKAHARTSNQLMGQLPPSRVNPTGVFLEVGVDFAGPLTLKKGHTRRPVLVKGYVCLFVCMATKAVHLEPVSDLSTPSFLETLHRFMARRGKPRVVHCDNGTNFVGANHELKEIYNLLQSKANNEQIQKELTNHNVIWKHIPGRAPHFGGLWESQVKAMKHHLRKTFGAYQFSIEELFTILARVEASLNSRPLIPLDNHSLDGCLALTPGHFLIGRPLLSLPTRQNVQPQSLTKRWQLCQHLSHEFWRLWSRDYITTLNQRHKWSRPARNLRVGDVVMLKDQELFMNSWPLGKVLKTFPGEDGAVRAVDVQAKGNIYRRPIQKLVLLLPEDELPSSSRAREDGYA